MPTMTERKQVASGCPCPRDGCGGALTVYKTVIIVSADVRVRYHKCARCGRTPDNNQQTVPLAYAPARASRVSSRQK